MKTGSPSTPGTDRLSANPRRRAGLASVFLAGVIGVAAAWAATPTNPPTPAPADAAEEPAIEIAAEPPSAVDPANPYHAVVSRNPFGLKDPPPPKAPEPEPEPEPEVEPSALKLSAISTLLSKKHAMFVLEEKGKGQERVYSGLVAEGDIDDYIAGLEVLAIDPATGSVRVNYGGNELLLDFKNNGLDPHKAAARAPGGKPRVVAGARGVTTRRGGATAVRTSRTPSNPTRAGSSTWTAPGANRGSSSPNPAVVPSRSFRSTNVRRSDTPVLSPAQQVLVMRAQAQAGQSQGIPMPPSPPIPGLDASGGAPPVPGQ
jgi:hypothetical protein